MNTKQDTTDYSELDLRMKAVELTVQYFLDSPKVGEDVFMRHLERVYNFLKTGHT